MRPKKKRVEYGSLGRGAERAFGSLGIQFLVRGGPRAPVTAMRVAMKPGASHAPLYHEVTSEFILVLKGSLDARIGGRRRRCGKGDYVFLPPKTTHEFHAGAAGVEVLSVFTPALDMRNPDIVYTKG